MIGSTVAIRRSRWSWGAAADSGVGVLRFVGTVASLHAPKPAAGDRRRGEGEPAAEENQGAAVGEGEAARLYAGVVWDTAPRRAVARRERSRRDGGRAPHRPHDGVGTFLEDGHVAYVEARGTWLPDDAVVATLEYVHDIVFLAPPQPPSTPSLTSPAANAPVGGSDDVPQAPAQPPPQQHQQQRVPPPRTMSTIRALWVALGWQLMRLGYWRIFIDGTTFAAPMVLRAFVKYLHQDSAPDDSDGSSGSWDGSDSSGGAAPSAGGVFAATWAFLGPAPANVTGLAGPLSAPSSIPSMVDSDDWRVGLIIVALFFLVSFVHNVSLEKYAQLCYRTLYTFRSATCAVILEKAMTIEARSLSLPGFHSGRIVNMLTNDVEQLEQMVLLFWPTVITPIQVTYAVYFLYRMVGWAVFGALGVSLLFLPVQLLMTMRIYRCYSDLSRAVDARVKATNEFLSGIRAAKFMSWETVFLSKIQEKRRVEMRFIKRSQELRTALSFSTDIVSDVVTAALFAMYFFSGNSLSPEVIYPTLSLVSLMCLPFRLLPLYANWISYFVVAMNRITAFLERPDGDDADEVQRVRAQPDSAADGRKYAVEFLNATVTASVAADARAPTTATAGEPAVEEGAEDPQARPLPPGAAVFLRAVPVLTDITVRIPRGKLTVIIGPTGSGKSCLLNVLIGALEVSAGSVLLRDNDSSSIAYVAERPWIMDGSVEENVLFFSARDRHRLRATLLATQLQADLAALPDGLATRVGEKGISLSGGQQARLALARAVYAPGKELYLLDDPIAALDPRVAQAVVRDCLLDMLKGKTRVLATHQTEIAQHADHVIVMDGGRVEFQGDYASYRAYARGVQYQGRRSGFVEHSAANLPATRPGSLVALDDLVPSDASAAHHDTVLSFRGQLPAPPSRGRLSIASASMSSAAAAATAAATAASMAGPNDGVVRSSAALSARDILSPTTAAAVASTRTSRGPPFGLGDSDDDEDDLGRLDAGDDAGDDAGALAAGETPTLADGVVPLSMVADEEVARGSVPMALYMRFVKACGGHWALFAFVGVYIFSELLMTSPSLWLSLWSSRPTPAPQPNPPTTSSLAPDNSSSTSAAPNYWGGAGSGFFRGYSDAPSAPPMSEETSVYIYLACVLLGAIGFPLRFLISYRFLRRGSRVMQAQLLLSVSRATMGFFDAVPLGRLMNRFSRDVRLVDGLLPNMFIFFTMSCVYMSSSLIIMVGSQLATLVFVIPFIVVFYKIAVFNCATVRSLQRLDNVATTPVVSILGDLMTGRWTIAAFQRSSEMLMEALRRLDDKFSASYSIVVAQEWVAVRMNVLSTTLLTTVALLGIVSRQVPWVHINRGLISLTITNAGSFTAVLSRLMDTSSALEATMSSVERVVQYTDNAPQDGGGFFDPDKDDDDDDSDYYEHSRFHGYGGGGGASSSGHDSRGLPPSAGGGGDEDEDDAAGERGRLLGSAQKNRTPTNDGLGAGAAAAGSKHGAPAGGRKTARGGATAVTYDATLPPSTATGGIELQHVYLRYRTGLPFVLQDLTFSIRAGERIGVVGRTGSGKSSLMLVLMRLVEVTAGRVLIAGRDVSSFRRVEDLRQLFAVVPQDPVLFDGTVRSNLDPRGGSTDDEVWAALEHVGMARYLINTHSNSNSGTSSSNENSRSDNGHGTASAAAAATEQQPRRSPAAAAVLAMPVTEGGQSWSVGQRQLMCLARALLKKGSRILLMDEATAGVDGVMDRHIQAVVKREFATHTIVAIAHRLHTVAQCDRILMLDDGRVACFGTPAELMDIGECGSRTGDGATPSPLWRLVESVGPDAVRQFCEQMKEP